MQHSWAYCQPACPPPSLRHPQLPGGTTHRAMKGDPVLGAGAPAPPRPALLAVSRATWRGAWGGSGHVCRCWLSAWPVSGRAPLLHPGLGGRPPVGQGLTPCCPSVPRGPRGPPGLLGACLWEGPRSPPPRGLRGPHGCRLEGRHLRFSEAGPCLDLVPLPFSRPRSSWCGQDGL